MNLIRLAEEYRQQHQELVRIIKDLRKLSPTLSGTPLLNHKKKIKVYSDMSHECKTTAYKLRHYYERV